MEGSAIKADSLSIRNIAVDCTPKATFLNISAGWQEHILAMHKLNTLIIAGAALVAASCQSGNKGPVTSKEISAQTFDSLLTAKPDAQLVDVRTNTEYNGGHLKNARNIDVNTSDFKEQFSSMNKKKPVFVYCLGGGRGNTAAEELKELGFTEIYNLQGGITSWRAAGKPVEQGVAPRESGMTTDDLAKAVNKPNYVLVDFNAQWCGPCKKLSPRLDELGEQKRNKLSILKIDADANPALLAEKKIEGIPYLELYKNGELVWKHEGFITAEDLIKETHL